MSALSVWRLGGLLIGVGGLCLFGCGGDSETGDAADAMLRGTNLDMQTDSVVADAAVGMDGMRAPADSATAVDAASRPDSAVNVEVARCEEPLGGLPWTNMVVESTPGFEADLASVDVSDLPEEVDISAMNGLFRGLIAYALDVAPEQLGGTLRTADLLAGGPLGRSVAASLALGAGSPVGIDFPFLRRGLHRYYHCGRGFPRTLDGFREAVFDFRPVESDDVDSLAKCGTRRLTTNDAEGVYVAETIIDGEVRETEILLRGGRQDGNLDFLIYNAEGQLSDRSEFPTIGMGPHVLAASPYVCMTCHLNRERAPDTFGYDLLFPDVGPCAR